MSTESLNIFRKRFQVALFNFIIIAAIGTILRYVYVHEISIVQDYKNVLHAHSHIAMMGWVFMALFGALLHAFAKNSSHKKIYHILFWSNQVCVLLLIPLFWLYGYNTISIILSTVYVVITYIFAFHFFRDARKEYHLRDHDLASKIAPIAIFFLLFSTLGIWAIAPSVVLLHGGAKVIAYYLSVQFYIHFQYNGWFIFGCLALFFSLRKHTGVKESFAVLPLWLFAISSTLTYSLSLFWGFPQHKFLLYLSLGAAIIQLPACFLIFYQNRKCVKEIFADLKPAVKILFLIAGGSLLVKQILQIIIVYPDMARTAFILRNYVIAYLHLTFLGVTTIFLIGYAWQKGVLILHSAFSRFAITALVICIFIIEGLLGTIGSLSWAGKHVSSVFYQLIFIFSLSIVLSAVFIWAGNWWRRKIES